MIRLDRLGLFRGPLFRLGLLGLLQRICQGVAFVVGAVAAGEAVWNGRVWAVAVLGLTEAEEHGVNSHVKDLVEHIGDEPANNEREHGRKKMEATLS